MRVPTTSRHKFYFIRPNIIHSIPPFAGAKREIFTSYYCYRQRGKIGKQLVGFFSCIHIPSTIIYYGSSAYIGPDLIRPDGNRFVFRQFRRVTNRRSSFNLIFSKCRKKESNRKYRMSEVHSKNEQKKIVSRERSAPTL